MPSLAAAPLVLSLCLSLCLCLLPARSLGLSNFHAETSARELYLRAVQLVHASDYEASVEVLRVSLERDPGSLEAMQLLGSLYVSTRPAQAEQLLHTVLEARGWEWKDNEPVIANYVEALRAQGPSRHADSVAAAHRGVKAHPQSRHVLYNAAIALQHAGRLDEAYRLYLRLNEMFPDMDSAWNRVSKHDLCVSACIHGNISYMVLHAVRVYIHL